MYQRLYRILEYATDNANTQYRNEAMTLGGKFLENYTDFFEMMAVASKLRDLQAVTEKCLKENKSVVIYLKDSCDGLFSEFRNEPCFDGLPFSAAM